MKGNADMFQHDLGLLLPSAWRCRKPYLPAFLGTAISYFPPQTLHDAKHYLSTIDLPLLVTPRTTLSERAVSSTRLWCYIESSSLPLICSQKLIDRGHNVVIITHAYDAPARTGIRYLTNRIKVYHLPHWIVYRSTTFPTVFSSFPILRQIFIRERIQVVHGHGSLSNLCHEGLLHARTMSLGTVFTDHSLFGFSDAASIMANKLLKFSLSDVGHVICVSHTW